MIIVQRAITADNSDHLAGTDLANIPSDGQLDVYIASTQNDTTITITGPGQEPIVRASAVLLRTNGMPLLKDDYPISIPVFQGAHYVVNIDIVTAATVGVIYIYRSLDELSE